MEEKVRELEERIEQLEKVNIPFLIQRQMMMVEKEIETAVDQQYLEVLHSRLQEYIRLAIEYNKC